MGRQCRLAWLRDGITCNLNRRGFDATESAVRAAGEEVVCRPTTEDWGLRRLFLNQPAIVNVVDSRKGVGHPRSA
jgi:hypothetical protein